MILVMNVCKYKIRSQHSARLGWILKKKKNGVVISAMMTVKTVVGRAERVTDKNQNSHHRRQEEFAEG